MRLDSEFVSDQDYEDDQEASLRHRKVQQLIEDRLEQQRLRDELKDFEDDWEDRFDWDEEE